MNKIILYVAIALMATLAMVSAKCDMMKEFKPDFQQITGWAEKKCKESPKISDADMAKAKACYDKCFAPLLTSNPGKKVAGFVQSKVFGSPCITNVCSDKACQENIKKSGIKDVGMKNGMALKKEVEADCPKFKNAFNDFNAEKMVDG